MIGVGCRIVGEALLGKAAVGNRAASLGPGDIGRDAARFAGLDVFALVVAHVRHGIDALDVECLSRGPGGVRQQAHVGGSVGDVLFDDQLVLRIDRHLRVVADRGLLARDHRARIGVGQRNLALAAGGQLAQHCLLRLPLLAHPGDLCGQRLAAPRPSSPRSMASSSAR